MIFTVLNLHLTYTESARSKVVKNLKNRRPVGPFLRACAKKIKKEGMRRERSEMYDHSDSFSNLNLMHCATGACLGYFAPMAEGHKINSPG